MNQHVLAPHVYWCLTDDHAVLLDTKREKYYGIHSQGLSVFLDHSDPGIESLPAETQRLITRMRQAGVVIASPDAVNSRPRTNYEHPTVPLIEGYVEERVSLRFRDGLLFLKAHIQAMFLLRFRRLDQIIRRLEKRRRSPRVSVNEDLSRLRVLVGKFRRLHPLLFSSRENCVRDSLALIEFLAAQGFAVTWLIGVHTRPFEAHSWVQQNGVVLNDSPGHVRRYTPILAA